MTTIRRIPTSKIDGNNSNATDTDEIRPYGEIAVYVGDNNKLELLMFDGVRTHLRSKVLNKGTFYGGDADSGDGEGYDTIKLVPDEVLRRNGSDQYLIIDPTGGEPNHIHIRAGGTIDQSTADLFLGGEQQNVRVSDTNDRVTITTDLQNTWTFGADSSLTLPGSEDGTPVIDFFEGATGNHQVRLSNDWTVNIEARADGANEGHLNLIAGQNTRVDINGEGSTVEIITGDGESSNTWQFDNNGGLTFPDNTVQTTAWTGQTGSGVIYIMANIDGDIVTSTDGVTWGDPIPSGMTGIERVAVHNGVIVYISAGEGGPSQPGLYYSTTIGTVTLCAGTDNIDNNDVFWNQVRYFDEAQKWVAVGYIDGGTNNFPIVAHSANGISWTLVPADNTFVAEFNTTDADWELTDVAYLAETGDFVISSNLNSEGAYGGIFITNNVTVPLDGTVHIAIDLNVDHTAPWSVIGFGGPPGYMILFGTGDEVWFGFGTDLGNYGSLDGEGPFSWAAIITDQIGYLPEISEIAYDADGFIAVTTGGHVITASVAFDGPNFIVSIPLPFTTTDFSITNANPAVISFTGESANNNEKIVITLAGEYNGTYYVNSDTGVLYTDQAMTTALDASTFASFTTGTVTFSHGQYFDAAGTSPTYYYIGNDDEQIFRSSNGITWTLLADVDGVYFNDFAYGTFGTGSASTLINGEYTVALENNGAVTLPEGGTITEGVVTDNPTIQLTPANPDVTSQKLVIKGGAGDDYHLHLTNGDLTETSLIIGTDEHNIRTITDGAIQITAYDYSVQEQKYWYFSPQGSLTFPDITTQTTAWSGGRVVDAPASSTGAEGDKAGDLAFSTGHIYYCFEDYDTGVSYNTTLSNITETDNKFIFAKNEGIIEPEIGWSITVDVGGENEETHTITLVEDLATDWRVTWSGGNVTFDPGTAIRVFSTNIWKRVAWSNDVW
jgi:hypothetical protein